METEGSMTVVLCDERLCVSNNNGVCRMEAIHIVAYRGAWDCTRFERDWREQAKQELDNEARSSQTHS